MYDLPINVNENELDDVDTEKLLGVHIDPQLHFNKHVDYVCKTVKSKIAS